MQHLDEGTIHAWLDGALAADQAADVERHVAECAECAALVADARGVIAGAARIVSALDDVPGGVIPKRHVPTTTSSLWGALRLTPFRAALAASLMVAAATLAVVRHAPEPASLQPAAEVKSMTVPAVASAPQPVQVADTSKLEKRLRLRVVDEAPPAPPAARPAAPPAVPAERQANAMTSELRKSKVATDSLTSVSVTAATAPAARPAAAAGAAAADADTRALSRDVLLRREALARPFSFVLTSANEQPLELPGCYQLVRDSAGPALQLPDRFSLESSTDPAVRGNVLRPLTNDGRRDSVVAGITWRAGAGTDRVVVLSNASLSQSQSIARSQSFGGRGAAGFVGSTARIARVDCR